MKERPKLNLHKYKPEFTFSDPLALELRGEVISSQLIQALHQLQNSPSKSPKKENSKLERDSQPRKVALWHIVKEYILGNKNYERFNRAFRDVVGNKSE